MMLKGVGPAPARLVETRRQGAISTGWQGVPERDRGICGHRRSRVPREPASTACRADEVRATVTRDRVLTPVQTDSAGPASTCRGARHHRGRASGWGRSRASPRRRCEPPRPPRRGAPAHGNPPAARRVRGQVPRRAADRGRTQRAALRQGATPATRARRTIGWKVIIDREVARSAGPDGSLHRQGPSLGDRPSISTSCSATGS